MSRPRLSRGANADGTRNAALAQKITTATASELVVYYCGASGKATPKLAYDALTRGVRADQTPSRLHTIVDADTGATLLSWDEIENGTGNGKGIHVGTVNLDTTVGPPWSMRDSVGNDTADLNGSDPAPGRRSPGRPTAGVTAR